MAAEKIDALELDIEAKLNAENLDKLIDRLALLGKVLDNLKGKSVSVNIKETGNASEKASSQVDKLTDSFLHQAVKITALIAVYRKLTNWISDGITSSMEYTENLNLFTVSLGEYAENANKYANTVRDALGIDPSGWIRTQGVFNTLIEGFGVGAEQAAYMSQNLTQLTYDIASFYNLSISDAEKKIQSAVAGELEPVRRLGYDLSQNALTAIAQNPEYYGKTTYYINEETGALEANTEALDDNTARVVANFNDLTQGEKVQLRYIALMTQVTEAQGDMARTLNDPANQMRIFKEQTEMTSRALGNAFIPMLNKAMPYVIAFARVLEETFQKIAAYLGYELPDMSDRINVDDAVGGYEDVEDALEGGAKAAKKIKDYTIGIDELNVLRPDDNTGRGSGSDNQYALGSIYETPGYDFLGTALENNINNAKKQLDEFIDWLTNHPLEVVGYFAWEGLGTIGEGFWEWVLGKSPEELAEDAEAMGAPIGAAFAAAFFHNTTNKVIWDWLFGKTPEEVRTEAETEGYSVGYAYVKSFLTGGKNPFSKGTELAFSIAKLFGYDADKDMFDDVAKQAQKLGMSFGEYLFVGITKSIVQAFADNPVLAELYEVATGRDIEKDLEALEKKLGGGDSGRTQSRYQSKPTAEGKELRLRPVTTSDKLGNTSADEARKRGEAQIKAYAKGMNGAIADVEETANNIFSSAIKGIDNNGNGIKDFFNVSSAEITRYVDGIKGGKSSAGVAGRDVYSSAYNGVSNNGMGGNSFLNVASNMTSKFIEGINNGSSNANRAGATLYDSAYKGASKDGKGATEFANTAAYMSNTYASGLLHKLNEAFTSGDALYKKAYGGASKDGKAGSDFSNLADNFASLFAKTLGSKTNTDNAYDSGVELSRQGVLGAWAYEDEFYDAGADSGAGFAHGIISKIEDAEEAGRSVALKTLGLMKEVLDEHSPSKETEAIGRFFTQGYAKGILGDADKVTEAVRLMSQASIRAANTDFISDVSVSIPRSNAGYNIGMNNESAMASLASNIYQAVVSGMATYGGNNGDTIIMIDGKEVFRVVQSEARKRGAEISNGAFSR